MFTDIVAALPEGYGYVLFDYNDVYGTEVKLTDFTEQVRRLRSIIAWVQKQQNVTDVHILAHSMGCIVVALAKPDINGKVILLASPTSIGARTREYFTSKRGAKVDGDNWVVPRQDGTRTIIPLSFFDEFESVNVKEALRSFENERAFTMVAATDDEVLKDLDYSVLSGSVNVRFLSVDGADHNFSGASRQKLISIVEHELE